MGHLELLVLGLHEAGAEGEVAVVVHVDQDQHRLASPRHRLVVLLSATDSNPVKPS